MARRLGHTPAFLTRGYKGRTSGPVWVDPASHTARDVGDEPLLLARDLPTVVARDRAAGARFIAQTRSDVDLLIMDDGLQNPALVKDLAIAVVDGRRGIGNARVIPSGPLRAPLAFQRALVDLVIVNAGSGPGNEAATLGNVFEPPVEAYAMRVVPRDPDWRAGAARAIAYAGIGNPENFFATLRTIGIDLVETRAYPDHHAWRDADILDLLGRARRHGVPLVTTEKDHARLDTRRKSEAALAEASRVLAIDVVLEEAAATAIEARLARLTT